MALDFGSIFASWEGYGLYDIVLPFLLVFAVVFGILSSIKIFGGKSGIHAIIALVLGLLAVRFQFFTDFLGFISPRLGVGIVILLVLIILVGLFVPRKSQHIIGWVFMAIGILIGLYILGQAYGAFGPGGFEMQGDLVSGLIFVALLIGIIVAVVTAGGSDKQNPVKNAMEKIGLEFS